MKEKRHRSLLKSISWRIVGTLDTILLSWIFTRTVKKALSIGGIELFTKILLYYLHERAWQEVRWGRRQTTEDGGVVWKEEHRRSVVKGISWRITGTIDTTLIALLVTGDYSQAAGIGMTEVVTKVFLYYLHERVWHKINVGQ